MTRFAMDANVLVYSVDRRDRSRQPRAFDLVARAAAADCVLPVQALGEFYNSAVRKVGLPPAAALTQIDDWAAMFPTAATTLASAREGAALSHRHGLAFWDAQMIATARAAGVSILLTEDMQDGATIAGVTIRNPFAGSSLPADIEGLLA